MAPLARSLIAIGTLFLTHAAYSAHEHTQLLSLHPSASLSSASDSTSNRSPITQYLPALKAPAASFSLGSLPADIVVETLVALFLLTLGIVLSAEPLKPILWREWAAGVEHGKHGSESKYIRKDEDRTYTNTAELGQELYGGPSVEGFGWLEDGKRMGFFNIKARRKEFADWVRKDGAAEG